MKFPEESLPRLSAAMLHHSNGQQEIKERASLSMTSEAREILVVAEDFTRINNAAVLTGFAIRFYGALFDEWTGSLASLSWRPGQHLLEIVPALPMEQSARMFAGTPTDARCSKIQMAKHAKLQQKQSRLRLATRCRF